MRKSNRRIFVLVAMTVLLVGAISGSGGFYLATQVSMSVPERGSLPVREALIRLGSQLGQHEQAQLILGLSHALVKPGVSADDIALLARVLEKAYLEDPKLKELAAY